MHFQLKRTLLAAALLVALTPNAGQAANTYAFSYNFTAPTDGSATENLLTGFTQNAGP